MDDGVSILICTYNGEKLIPETLKCLLKQENTKNINWEVILVDNASKDNTAEVAKSIWNHKEVPLRIIPEPRPGKTNAMFTGFSEARYEYVSIVDDDNRVEPDYISRIYSIMDEHPDVGICGGQGIGEFETDPPGWFDQYQNALGIGAQNPQEGYVDEKRDYLYGACTTHRKTVWDYLINNDFKFLLSDRKGKSLSSGGDYELCLAFLLSGYKLWYDPDLKFRHYIPEYRIKWNYLRKLFKAFGKSSVIISQYKIELNRFSKLRTFILSKYYLFLLFAFYEICIKTLPFLIARLFNYKGNPAIIGYDFRIGKFLGLLEIKGEFNKVRDQLVTRKWHIPNNQDT